MALTKEVQIAIVQNLITEAEQLRYQATMRASIAKEIGNAAEMTQHEAQANDYLKKQNAAEKKLDELKAAA
jgi:hypothetical protein